MRGSRKFSQGGVQIPRRGLTENFNMAKTNNLAIPGGVRTPCPPLWIRPCIVLCSEKKGADQLRSYCEADCAFLFAYMQNVDFLMKWLISSLKAVIDIHVHAYTGSKVS